MNEALAIPDLQPHFSSLTAADMSVFTGAPGFCLRVVLTLVLPVQVQVQNVDVCIRLNVCVKNPGGVSSFTESVGPKHCGAEYK